MKYFKLAIGRNPDEEHRAATPLELFFDLVYVVAIAIAAAGLHHQLLEHHVLSGIGWYMFAFFVIWWCWMNFTWYASAFDTDDTLYRILTFLQIFGALVLAVGINDYFDPEHDLLIALIGYIIMRFAMVFHWLRAAVSVRKGRKSALTYALGIGLVQLLWILDYYFAGDFFIFISILLIFVELSIPVLAEYFTEGQGTPWHPHHIAERYGLLVIIVLGEGVLATTNTIASLINSETQWLHAFSLGLGTAGLVFTLWWSYFEIPFGKIIHQHKNTLSRALIFGYGHYFIFATLAAVGVGLQLVADAATTHVESNVHAISPQFALLVTSTAVGFYLLFMTVFRTYLIQKSKYNWISWVVAIAFPAIPVGANYLGIPLHWSINLSVLAPIAFIILNRCDEHINKKSAPVKTA